MFTATITFLYRTFAAIVILAPVVINYFVGSEPMTAFVYVPFASLMLAGLAVFIDEKLVHTLSVATQNRSARRRIKQRGIAATAALTNRPLSVRPLSIQGGRAVSAFIAFLPLK